jgi:hypothetical protein
VLKKKNAEIESILIQRGFRLLDTYQGMSYSHRLICKKGHEVKIRLDSVVYRGKGCGECYRDEKLTSVEKVQDFIRKKGFSCLDADVYKNEKSELTYLCCTCGFEQRKKFSLFKKYHQCPNCTSGPAWVENLKRWFPHFLYLNRNSNRFTVFCTKCKTEKKSNIYNMFKKRYCRCDKPTDFTLFELHGYTVLAEPKRKNGRKDRWFYDVRCANGHRSKTSIRYMLEGRGCLLCKNKNASAEISEFIKFFTGKGYTTESKVKGILPGNTILDVYIPDANIAINYVSFSKESYEVRSKQAVYAGKPLNENTKQKIKKSNQRKMLLCLQKGMRLFTIFESDMLHNKVQVFAILGAFLSGYEPDTKDLRWVSPISDQISEPRPHYFNKDKVETTDMEQVKYTLYDCGISLR